MIVQVCMIDDGHPWAELVDVDKLDPVLHVGLIDGINEALSSRDGNASLDFDHSFFNSDNDYSAALCALPFTGTVSKSVAFYVESD
jgi:hypothetical protein